MDEIFKMVKPSSKLKSVHWAIPENIHNPPMDDTEFGCLKISGFPRMAVAVFALAGSKS